MTGILPATTVFDHDPALCVDLFTVYGRVRIVGLNFEVTTVLSNNAALLKWQFESTTPVIAASDISAVSLTVAQMVVGGRIMWRGTAVATAPDISATQASIAVVDDWMDVGLTGGVGIISSLATTATLTSGAGRFNLYYLPISEGAYATAIV